MSSSNRKPYLTATTINEQFLSDSNDNLSNQIEYIAEIVAPDGDIIRVSDRNKYVGEHFYEALTKFPTTTRTIGEYLSQGVVFSEMTFELSNADGRYNKYLAGGANFAGWIGRSVVVKVGLRDVESSYVQIFRGTISEEGGFSRSVKSITIKARAVLEKINLSFPNQVFDATTYPKAKDDTWGKIIPVIYGDWTVNITPGFASVPVVFENDADIFVNSQTLAVTVTLSPNGSTPVVFTFPNHRLDVNDHIDVTTDGSLPAPLTGDHYVISVTANEFTIGSSPGGPAHVVTSGTVSGNHSVKAIFTTPNQPENLKCTISANTNTVFDTNQVWLKRSEKYFKIPISSLTNIAANKNKFEILQHQNTFKIDGVNWVFDPSDEIFVRVKGKDLGAYSDNTVSIARDILETYAGVISTDLDTTWDTYRDKSSPSTAAVSSWKCRAYLFEQQNALEYAVSLLEQVRIELFESRSQKLSLKALHFDEFVSSPTFRVKNWDVERESLTPQIDDQNNFNRARAAYGFLPDYGENAFTTRYYKNQAAITQSGKTITKAIVYPNLYREQDVIIQLQETLKIASSYREVITLTLTNKALLRELGDFISLDVQIGSSIFNSVPCQIREISYSPEGLKLPMKLWSFAMIPYGTWNPGYTGIVGGQNATIAVE